MIVISYFDVFFELTLVFVTVFICDIVWNKKLNVQRTGKMFLFYITLLILTRIVYFPMHHVNGRIQSIRINLRRLTPVKHNLVPVIHLFEYYDDWLINILGNIVVFIPVGIIWPVCFNKLNSIKKTVLAGGNLSLFIELSQLLLIERCTDIDDLILNTAGVLIGALIYFGIKRKKSVKVDYKNKKDGKVLLITK